MRRDAPQTGRRSKKPGKILTRREPRRLDPRGSFFAD
jgi:hypothetical protein